MTCCDIAGPIGLTALLAAKLLGLRTSGISHTDFPQYVRILTDDNFLDTLKSLCAKVMQRCTSLTLKLSEKR